MVAVCREKHLEYLQREVPCNTASLPNIKVISQRMCRGAKYTDTFTPVIEQQSLVTTAAYNYIYCG